MGTAIHAGRGLYQRAAWLYEQKQPFDMEASMAKLFSEEMVVEVAEKALRLHGGIGYTKAPARGKDSSATAAPSILKKAQRKFKKLVISRELLK